MTTAQINPAAKPAEFRRFLTLTHLVLFGITFVGPTAPFPMFGIVSSISRGHMATSYLIALVAMLLTAFSYGRMAAVFPAAGSAYSYARHTLSPFVGFVAGWTMLLDYLLMPLMSVIYLSLTVARFVPVVPQAVWLILFATGITVINLFGLKVTNQANYWMSGIMSAIVIAFVFAAVRALLHGAGEGALFSLKPFYNPAEFAIGPVMAATSIAAFSYLGFDGISTLAEDSRNPTRDIGRATVLVCLICGVIFILQAWLGQLVWPDFRSYPNTETAFLDVSRRVGGATLLALVSVALMVAGLASAITGQASASRLLFGMGRDRLLPSLFVYIHPKYSTPTYGILVMGVITVLGGFYFSFQLAAEAINFGALLGFICVNLSVISHYFIKGKQRRGLALVTNLAMPLTGFLVCFYVFLNLSRTATVIGSIWCVAGIIYVGIRARGFRNIGKLSGFAD